MELRTSGPAERHRQVAHRFTEVVAGVEPSGWDSPSPVDGWRARDVVEHLVEWLPGLLAAASEIVLPEPRSADPAIRWSEHAAAVQAVLDHPAMAGSAFSHPHVGDLAVAEAIDRLYAPDVHMHTWDLARATGQDDHLDEGWSEDLLAGMRPIEQALRDSGQYGPAFAVDAGAPAHLRLMAFVGRDPAWTR